MRNLQKAWLWMFLLGTLISLGLYSQVKIQEEHHLTLELDAIGERKFHALNLSLKNVLSTLKAVGLLFEASHEVNREEFGIFVRPLLRGEPALQAVQWVPLVEKAQRAEFEKSHRWGGAPRFQITQVKQPGQMERRAEQEFYFPVAYVEPLLGNENSMGFDQASDATRRSSLLDSKQSNQSRVTGRVELVQETIQGTGILLMHPVTKEEGPAMVFRGFALAVLKIADLVDVAEQRSLSPNLDVEYQLTDLSAPPGQGLIYHRASLSPVQQDYRFTRSFVLGGRLWQLSLRPGRALLQTLGSWYGEVILVLGILLSCLLSGFFALWQGRTARVKEEVQRRTQELVESEEITSKIVENSVNGIITIDSRGRVELFNPAAERLFGYRRAEVLGKNVKILMPSPYQEEHDGYLSRYLQEGNPRVIGIGREVTGRRKDGSLFPMRLSVSEMHLAGKKKFVGMVIDLTEQKMAESQLVKAKEQAEEANRLKTEFLNTMSHELRTPLTVMLGNIYELTDEEQPPAPDEVLPLAKEAEKSGEHLLLLINDLLDLSRIEAGRMQLDLSWVEIQPALEDALNGLRFLAEEKGLELVLMPCQGQVWADPFRLKQILINLVGNAIKFTDQGRITLSVRAKEGHMLFQVQDTGMGISDEEQGFIFEPFRQADSSSVRRQGGTGLGLAITKKLVHLQGGELKVKSILNQGSIFYFTLPTKAQEES